MSRGRAESGSSSCVFCMKDIYEISDASSTSFLNLCRRCFESYAIRDADVDLLFRIA
ncbi:hypothetical protein XENOCAPTIV_016300, partial [Xenoophorus captivus]